MATVNSQTLEELSTGLFKYLETISFSKIAISRYEAGVRRIDAFMNANNYARYSAEVCERYIKCILGQRPYQDLQRRDKDQIRYANVLLEYQTSGVILYRVITKNYDFKGELGTYILQYFGYRRSQNISDKTLKSDHIYLKRFHDYLISRDILKIVEIKKGDILGFIDTLSFYGSGSIHCTLSTLKVFIKYLYENNHIPIDLSYIIPKDNYKNVAKLPSTYSVNEVEKLLSAIDRGNPKGKRDYAMVLLAARLGLRASDICDIKFTSLLWERDVIMLNQKKTGKQLELPLLEEIGSAIIDYLKYARPQSELPYVFIRHIPNFQKLKPPTLHSIVSFYLRRADINCERRKHGPHALRHSLAGLLLEKMTPIHVISEVLGHKSTESTKNYLRIDLSSLRQCAIEVPLPNAKVYNSEVK